MRRLTKMRFWIMGLLNRRYLKFRYAIMILRLVCSFFFFSLTTGNQRLECLERTIKASDCQNKKCICQDQLDLQVNKGSLLASPLNSVPQLQVLPEITEIPPQVAEVHYGYPSEYGLINANPILLASPQSRIETKSFDVEYVSDEGPSLQVQRPVQYVEEETENGEEKTICFTPSMVHRIIKAALEYVSQIPSDINNIIAQLDQELNRMSDQGYIEDNTVKKPLYPLDSKTIFQMLDKPKSESRTNLILKYELPSVKEPQCREALEKLIEIAYTAYTELEEHPQCREYLYNFAAHQPEDRPSGHLDKSPDLKSLIATILDQVNKHKPNLDVTPEGDRFGGIEIPELPSPQTQEYNKPQTQEYNNHQKPQVVEYNINEYSVPEVSDYNVPQFQEYTINEYSVPNAQELNKPALILPKAHEYTITETHEYNLPKVQEYTITENREYNVPKNHDYNINEYNVPNAQEFNKPAFILPKSHEYNVPNVQEYTITENHEYPTKVEEYTITKNHEYNVPQIKEFTITQTHEYPTKVHEYTITQNHEYNIPQIQDIIRPPVQTIEMPEIHEKIHETKEVKPMQPEETMNILIKLLQNSDQPDSGNLFDRLMNIVQENQNNFHPKILKILLDLLKARKQNKIHRFNDIFSLLLDSQRNQHWPWNDRITDNLLSYLTPNQNGNLDSRIVEIILNLHKKQPNEKHIEYILSLLRPLKEGKLDNRVRDLILKLINLHQNNLLHPDHVDILVKLLKPSQNGNVKPKEVDVADLLTRWNEIGVTPNQLNGLFALLKPYVNGHPDKRLIDIINFLLTKSSNLNPKHLDFILSFLFPENGVLDTRRIDIIHFLLNNVTRYPKQANILLTLLRDNTPAVLNSAFLDILLLLDAHKVLTPELVEVLVNIIKNDVTEQLDDNQVKTLFILLAPFKKSHPKLLVDVLTLLNQGGLHGNIVDWFESATNDLGVPNRDSRPQNLNIVIDELPLVHPNEYRTPDGGYQVMDAGNQLPENDFMSIFKWLESQGLITQDQGSNTDLVNKILNILEVGEQKLGVVELTYMLKHEKPLIYQPVYYVKYRLPILSFISNLKSLLQENPNLNADPMKLLQELIVISNVTEVSPNLQGFPKDEILKLTFNDGDLVQAKILDEQNLSLNDQISYVHGLNSDISPEEILALNRINEAKYFPNLKEVKGVRPDQLTIKDVDQFIDIPPIHYRHVEMNPGIVESHQTKTIHQTYNIARENENQDALNDNAQN